MADVKVGERSLTIPRFSAFKVVRAGRIVSRIAEKYPAILLDVAKFTRDYEDQNAIRITRAMAKTPRFRDYGFGAKDFEETGFVELPVSPTTQEQVFAVFPKIMEAAEEEVAQLIALVLAENSELADVDENGTVDDFLKQRAKKLLHEADADQILDVAVVAAAVLRDQFANKLGDSGNVLALFMGENSAEKPTNSPGSSSDSPTPSDGIEEPFSTAQDGRS